MKKIILPFWVLGLCLTSFSWGQTESFAEKCKDIASCAKTASEILSQRYLYDSEIKGALLSTPNVDVTRDTIEQLFTLTLHWNGYTRVPAGPNGTYIILRQRDARDTAIPVVPSDERTPPNLSDAWDLMTLKYKATYPENVEDMARLIRPFLAAQTRVVPSGLGGLLYVTASAPELKRIYDLIKDADVKPSLVFKKRWAEKDKTGNAVLKEKKSSLENSKSP